MSDEKDDSVMARMNQDFLDLYHIVQELYSDLRWVNYKICTGRGRDIVMPKDKIKWRLVLSRIDARDRHSECFLDGAWDHKFLDKVMKLAERKGFNAAVNFDNEIVIRK